MWLCILGVKVMDQKIILFASSPVQGFIDQEGTLRSIKRDQHPVILTKQTWSIKDLILEQENNFLAISISTQDSLNLPHMQNQ